jgi:hypothetical protein
MATVIKAGGVGTTSDPVNARPPHFANSMADAMDTAFHDLLIKEGMKSFEVNTNSQEARDRRRLFVAIAHGIVQHLHDNAGAFLLKDTLNNTLPIHIEIKVDLTLV